MPTLPYTPALLAGVAADAKSYGATESRSGFTFLNRQLSTQTTPTRFAAEIQQANRLYNFVIAFAGEWACEHVGGLNVGVNVGKCRKPDGTIVDYVGEDSFAIPANKTAYKVFYDLDADALDGDDDWPADTTTFFPIAEVDSDTAAVTSVRDARCLVAYWVPPTSTSITSTDDVKFTIDNDNAGAGATLQLRFNRGSTDAEDAAVEWDETNDRFQLRKQHTTATLAPVNVDSLQVGGATIIDSNGKLAAAGISSTTLYTLGTNGATPAGLAIAPGGGSGPPASGTHAAGELHIDSDNIVWQCTVAGTPGTWRRIARSDALTFVRLDLGADISDGASSKTVTIQAMDREGASLAGVQYFQLGVYQDVDGAAAASNATLSNAPSAGTFVRWITTDKVAIYKTNASGALTLDVATPNVESVYLLAAPAPRSGYLDCSDTLKLTKA